MGVLLIGAGGLGCAAAMALCATPVRRLGLVDPDVVTLSNLHRQVLYGLPDLGAPKVMRAAANLGRLRPDLVVESHPLRLEREAEIVALARTGGYRVIVDGSDNFATRFAANDAALASGLPLVHGAATGLRGQVMSIAPGQSACLRCLFGGPPTGEGETCRAQGVLGPLVAEVGGLMALEACKWLTGTGSPLTGRLLTIDLLRGRRHTVNVSRDPRCPGCGSVAG
ncbi:MAG: HesA/MoeB/ThiF family protein [Magnetococcales bacterium]|nr:HesA/MoeB/ThiF family protein [Magnetococcales bacterium]